MYMKLSGMNNRIDNGIKRDISLYAYNGLL